MAVVQGIMEKVHSPLYDSIAVEAGEQLGDIEKTGTLKFFVNVQGKTKLRTNLQAASLLPHYNTFEARALRVVISDLPPEFSEEKQTGHDYEVLDQDDKYVDVNGDPTTVAAEVVSADVTFSMNRIFELLADARASEDGYVAVDPDEPGVKLVTTAGELDKAQVAQLFLKGVMVQLHKEDLEDLLKKFPEEKQPPLQQVRLNDGAGTLIGKFIYNTVTTFYVGEKAMIQMPTWFFPAGAGPRSDTVKHVTHGDPTPLATFRFAEPIYIDRQQPFRVEIEVPESSVLKDLKRIYGPFQIWVVLDGFMTRGVQ